MKRSFFQAPVVMILLYGCTTWTLTKRMEKKLDGNYTRMLRAILNKSWRQLPTKEQLFGHLLPITKTIKVRRTKHAGHCWRSRDKLISNVSPMDLFTWPSKSRATSSHLHTANSSPEDLPEAMNDREKWRERVKDTHADGTRWWWWWWVWFGLVWFAGYYGISTSYGLFHAKSCLCLYIRCIWIVSAYFVV